MVHYKMNRRQVLQAAATAALMSGLELNIVTASTGTARKDAKQKEYRVPYSIGAVGISLTTELLKNPDYWLPIIAEGLGLPDPYHKRPTVEVLIAPNKELNLANPTKEQLQQFENLGEKIRAKGMDPTGLIFIPGNDYGNMASTNRKKRIQATEQVKGGVYITSRLGGELITGPWWFGQGITENINVANVHGHIGEVAEYAANYGITASAEPLRTKEGPINTLDQTEKIREEVGHPNFTVQWDFSHGYDGDGKILVPHVSRVVNMGGEDCHVSEHAEWGSDDNRGILKKGGHVYEQLKDVMKEFAKLGYEGALNFEAPCAPFWAYVGKGDTRNLAKMPTEFHNANAIETFRISLWEMLRIRAEIEKEMNLERKLVTS